MKTESKVETRAETKAEVSDNKPLISTMVVIISGILGIAEIMYGCIHLRSFNTTCPTATSIPMWLIVSGICLIVAAYLVEKKMRELWIIATLILIVWFLMGIDITWMRCSGAQTNPSLMNELVTGIIVLKLMLIGVTIWSS